MNSPGEHEQDTNTLFQLTQIRGNAFCLFSSYKLKRELNESHINGRVLRRGNIYYLHFKKELFKIFTLDKNPGRKAISKKFELLVNM